MTTDAIPEVVFDKQGKAYQVIKPHVADPDGWVRLCPLLEVDATGGYVVVPVELLKRVSDSLGAFTSDVGWALKDMETMDSLDALIPKTPPNSKR